MSASWLTRWCALVTAISATVVWWMQYGGADAAARLALLGWAVAVPLAAMLIHAVALVLTERRDEDGTRVCVAAALQLVAIPLVLPRYALACVGASVVVLVLRGRNAWIAAALLAGCVGAVGWSGPSVASLNAYAVCVFLPVVLLLVYAVAAHVEHHPHLDWTKR